MYVRQKVHEAGVTTLAMHLCVCVFVQLEKTNEALCWDISLLVCACMRV